LPPACSSIFCDGVCCALATDIPPMSAAVAIRLVIVFI
jgi:hypothetical protein